MRGRNFFCSVEGLGDFVPAGMGEETAPAPAAPTSLWDTVANVGKALLATGVAVAPAMIAAAIAKKTTVKVAAAPKPAAQPAPLVPGAYAPPAAKAGLPGWVIPVAIGGVALLGLGAFLKMRKK